MRLQNGSLQVITMGNFGEITGFGSAQVKPEKKVASASPASLVGGDIKGVRELGEVSAVEAGKAVDAVPVKEGVVFECPCCHKKYTPMEDCPEKCKSGTVEMEQWKSKLCSYACWEKTRIKDISEKDGGFV